MRIPKCFTLLVITLSPLLAGFSQTVSPPVSSQANASSNLSRAAAEVARLAQSGVSDDVVLAFIGQSHSYYNLSAADIAALKNAGVSSPAITAMLNHDGALRAGEPSASPLTPSDAASAPAVAKPAANTTVIVQSEPPPPQVEFIPASPGPDYLWAPGCWSWNGGAWIWIGGAWHFPARPGHVWIGGYWAGHGRSHQWVRGHWR